MPSASTDRSRPGRRNQEEGRQSSRREDERCWGNDVREGQRALLRPWGMYCTATRAPLPGKKSIQHNIFEPQKHRGPHGALYLYRNFKEPGVYIERGLYIRGAAVIGAKSEQFLVDFFTDSGKNTDAWGRHWRGMYEIIYGIGWMRRISWNLLSAKIMYLVWVEPVSIGGVLDQLMSDGTCLFEGDSIMEGVLYFGQIQHKRRAQ